MTISPTRGVSVKLTMPPRKRIMFNKSVSGRSAMSPEIAIRLRLQKQMSRGRGHGRRRHVDARNDSREADKLPASSLHLGIFWDFLEFKRTNPPAVTLENRRQIGP